MGEGRAALERVARTLGRTAPGRKAPSTLFFFTDPERTPDPVAVAGTLPRGSAVVYRHFGSPDARTVGEALRRVTRRRGVLLLIGEDERLAAELGADGVHLPERQTFRLRGLRRRRPRWVLTTAAHSELALRGAAVAGADGVVLSSVFKSRSPSAPPALGAVRFAAMARRAHVPVIALGGVNSRTAKRLAGTGAAGLAAVEGWLEP